MAPKQITFMKVVLLVSSLASLGVLAAAAFQENFRGEWRDTQDAYKTRLVAAATTDTERESAKSFRIEHRQVYLPELRRIDRCTTCHLGMENPDMTGVDQPLGRHPGAVLEHHPSERFGCTICHQGRGRATSREVAHGWFDDGEPVPHIATPMLRDEAVYTSCGRCHVEIDLFGVSVAPNGRAGRARHRRAKRVQEGGHGPPYSSSKSSTVAAAMRIDAAGLERTLPGAERLTDGKRLTVQSGCLGCHKYRGRGGTLGTDLTYVGDKTRHDFDFSHVNGEHTVEQWLFEHFKLPREISPDTLMPDMGLSDADARNLSLYMMALHRKDAPADLLPPPARHLTMTEPVRGETLYAMFCSACHGPEGFGTTMRTGLWPRNADPWGHEWDARNVVVEQRNEMDLLVPSLHHVDTLDTVSDEYLYKIIAEGRPGTKMPAWAEEGGLTDDDITLLVDFIRRWDNPSPDLDAVASKRGDPRLGAALYRSNCASCHGPGGEGGIGNSLNSPTFLAVASDAFLRDTVVFGRPNTAMPAWRTFNSQEISDLLAFIRTWQPRRADPKTALALCADGDARDTSAVIGEILFKANCQTCHGGGGEGDLGPSLNTQSFLTVAPDSYLIDTLIEGRPGTGMPSWRHLSSSDIASLVLLMRTWQTRPSKDGAWHARVVPRGDWDAGRFLFAGHCAGCHGPDGEGATGPQLNNPLFLRNASNVMLREWITHGKDGTPMRGFRKGGQGVTELSDRQIEDIISFLRLLERTGESEIARVAKSPNGRPENGAGIYARHCVGCHGTRGEGASGPALSNPNFLRVASDGFLMATMAMGRSGTEMRPVKRGPQSILGLTSDEINDLVAYLRSWEYAPAFGAADDPPHRFVVPWDLGRGEQLFQSNCAGCHGTYGKGSWAPELNNEGFLAAATDGFLQATIIRGRKGTAMRPFGRGAQGLTDLAPDDVDDIVAYVRNWSMGTPSPMTIPAQRSLDPSILSQVSQKGGPR